MTAQLLCMPRIWVYAVISCIQGVIQMFAMGGSHSNVCLQDQIIMGVYTSFSHAHQWGSSISMATISFSDWCMYMY